MVALFVAITALKSTGQLVEAYDGNIRSAEASSPAQRLCCLVRLFSRMEACYSTRDGAGGRELNELKRDFIAFFRPICGFQLNAVHPVAPMLAHFSYWLMCSQAERDGSTASALNVDREAVLIPPGARVYYMCHCRPMMTIY